MTASKTPFISKTLNIKWGSDKQDFDILSY